MDILWKADVFARAGELKLDQKAIERAMTAERTKHPRTQLLKAIVQGWTIHGENKKDHVQIMNIAAPKAK